MSQGRVLTSTEALKKSIGASVDEAASGFVDRCSCKESANHQIDGRVYCCRCNLFSKVDSLAIDINHECMFGCEYDECIETAHHAVMFA